MSVFVVRFFQTVNIEKDNTNRLRRFLFHSPQKPDVLVAVSKSRQCVGIAEILQLLKDFPFFDIRLDKIGNGIQQRKIACISAWIVDSQKTDDFALIHQGSGHQTFYVLSSKHFIFGVSRFA